MTPSTAVDSFSPAVTVPASERPRYATQILASSVVAGLLTRWAFGGALGLGFFAWVLALVAGYALAGGREAIQQARSAWVWAAGALGFAGFVVLRDAPELTFFNASAAVGLLALAARDAVMPRARTRLFDFVGSVAEAGLGASKGSFTMLGEAGLRAVELKQRAPGEAGAVLRGLALATPVVLVLAALLMSGDAHFRELFHSTTGSLPDLVLTVTDWGFWSLLSAAGVAGLWTYALRRSRRVLASAPAKQLKQLGATEGMIVLGSVVGLFGTYLAVQMAWLFAQDPSQRGTGLTYATYAKEGVFELTVVAAITWWLVEVSRRRVRATEGSRSELAMRVLGSAVLAQAMVILVSAHARLALYDDMYGLTLLRLYGHAVVALLGSGLFLRLATLWVAQRATANLVFGSGLLVLGALDVLNPHALVARWNLAREQSSPIDASYLAGLSADAADELIPAFSAQAAHQEDALGRWACAAKQRAPTSLASFNFARRKAAALGLPCVEYAPPRDWRSSLEVE